jgi:PKD repeat protein
MIFSLLLSRMRLGCAAGLFTFCVAATSAQPVTNVRLPAPVRGAAAISALGANLPTVAHAYGLDAQKLTTLLQTQPSLGVDMDGALTFACQAPAAGSLAIHGEGNRPGTTSDAMPAGSSVTTIASGGTVDAFQLHSLPGATRVIYLDFDGHTTSGTQWNSSYTGGANIVSQPFDLDGSPSTFSSTERAVIQGIWQRVAEDYAPFGVDVTTQDPGVEGLRRTTTGDDAYGIRAVISPTSWYGGAGGVGYVGSFNWNSDTPVFIFSSNLANAEKYIAEAVSHEVGHSLGLYHDGLNGGTEYYTGQGNWAPIMGNSYYASVTQFSRGEYANANNTEDDLAIIASFVPLFSDDHGNTLATATPLAGPSIADGGTIETRSDVDMFRFDTGAGAISLNITGPSPSPNLSAKVDLLNSSGQVVTSSLAGSIVATVGAGTYYLKIEGVGSGDPVTTGYSDYDSVGNYIITGTIVSTGANQAPFAVASATPTTGTAPALISFSSAGSFDPEGALLTYRWDFGDGSTSTSASPSKTYSTPGNYAVTLTVTDDRGATASAIVNVSISGAVNTAVDIQQFTLAATTTRGGTTTKATVIVRDRFNQPAAGVTIGIQWSGLVSGTSSGTTDSNGSVVVSAARTKKSGTINATITSVSPPSGSTYDPAIYPEYTASIVRSISF